MNKTQQLVDLICSKVEQHPEKVKVSKSPVPDMYIIDYETIDCRMMVNYTKVLSFPNFHIPNISLEFGEKCKLYTLLVPFIKDFLSEDKDDKLEEMINLWS